MNIYSQLPDVLINKIINYTNVITYRYGKYINKISKNDERYKLLDKIPLKIIIDVKFNNIRIGIKNTAEEKSQEECERTSSSRESCRQYGYRLSRYRRSERFFSS